MSAPGYNLSIFKIDAEGFEVAEDGTLRKTADKCVYIEQRDGDASWSNWEIPTAAELPIHET